jgi:hypothetical protein
MAIFIQFLKIVKVFFWISFKGIHYFCIRNIVENMDELKSKKIVREFLWSIEML